MTRIRLDIRYDGAPFHGWAAQPGLPTVQGALESALAVVFRAPVALTVAGRTDAGVHATGQVAHFDIPTGSSIPGTALDSVDLAGKPGEVTQPAGPNVGAEFLRRLDAVLALVLSGNVPSIPGVELDAEIAYPPAALEAIAVVGATLVPEGFDARFSALARHYVYRIVDDLATRNPLIRNRCWWYPTRLDETAMSAGATVLLGEHDFAAFCKPREGATTIRTLKRLDVTRSAAGVIRFEVVADAFCHSMVRSLVGALTEVGRAKRDTAWLASALAAKARIPEIPVAPPQGLTLTGVDYPQSAAELLARQQSTRSRRDCECPKRF